MKLSRFFLIAVYLTVSVSLALSCNGVIKSDKPGGSTNTPAVALDAGDAAIGDSSAACGNGDCFDGGGADSGSGASPRCGNNDKEHGEQCDDGNTVAGDGCDNHCGLEIAPAGPACGDAVLDVASEECDEGDTVPGDGCDKLCRKERCRNDRIDKGEDCDPPVAGLCDETCHTVMPNCGDGHVQKGEGEQCDDSNTAPGDGCNHCRKECGNGVLERNIGETCEPIYSLPDTCDDATCKRLPQCGDGTVDTDVGEQCDPSDGVTCVNCKISVDAGDADTGNPDGSSCSSALAQVAVVNGKFETDLASWAPDNAGAVTQAYLPAGANEQGSIEVTYNAGSLPVTTADGVVQCIPVVGNVQYNLVAQYYNPSTNDAAVLPGISIKLFATPDCQGAFTSGGGPSVSSAKDTWVPFVRPIDTSVLGDATGSLWVKLQVIVPAGVASGQMRYDDVALGSCGNCVVDSEAGETCDDGNTTSGDGCSPMCQFECGNAHVESPEQCDDGNFTYGDSCTPSCRNMTSCDTCAQAQCDVPTTSCLELTGAAQAGPSLGMPRSALCSQLRDCIHDSGCNLDTAIAFGPTLGGDPVDPAHPGVPENCYCGNAGVNCLQDGAANGSCKRQIEAALETNDPYQIIQRVGGSQPDFPAFAAVSDLLACEQAGCSAQCTRAISCGNGFVENRTEEFATSFKFLIERLPQPCLDEYTATQTGCSFEECDDSNTTDGDGCDSDCFVEACGNNLKQGVEECDDGNLFDGDGCDSSCVAEYVCGDTVINPLFEDCEPPSTGSVCSETQYSSDPTQCGCDSACVYKVCGNGLMQEGEECDPPNGASCDDNCQRNVDPCTECLLRVADGQFCHAPLFLNGSGIPGDKFELGCLQDPACLALWDCERTSLCFAAPSTFGNCWCGADADVEACDSSAAFVPTGVCHDELLAAFISQWGRPPTNNAEVISSFFLSSPSSPNSFYQSTLISDRCMIPMGTNRALYDQLLASGLSASEADACNAACFP